MNGHDSCVLVTGGFDPIHGGHIDYFQDAKLLSTYLIVGVNSDAVSYTHLTLPTKA